MASIYARKGILQIKYKTDEGWKQKSTGLQDTPENRKTVKNDWLPELTKILETKQEQILQLDKREPIEKYAMFYLLEKENLKTYWEIHSRVGKIVEIFKNRDIREIKSSEIKVWLSTLKVTKKTKKSYATNFRGIFEQAKEDNILEDNPFDNIKVVGRINEKESIDPFTSKEVKLILKHAPQPLKNFLAIGFYTGMRSGEILSLQLSDIYKDSISVKRSVSKGSVSTPKTIRSIRDVPLFDVLRPYLKEQVQIAKSQKSIFLFSKNGKHLYGVDTIRGSKKYGTWSKLLNDLDIEYRKIYNTRHTFITAMLKSGQLSVLEIAQIVGHTNTKMILENYARYIEGEHLKIKRSFNPFQNGGVTHGDIRGDTA